MNKMGGKRFADDHTLDNFYLEFENEFRGSESDIEELMIFYAEFFKRAGLNYEKYPILDIGCGRGELLKILRRYSLNAAGIDLNDSMVKRAKALGLSVKQADAARYFSKTKQATLSAVIGIHIIEHIPSEEFIPLLNNIHGALVKGGMVIFETPNPENISVGSNSFYLDPSHLRPVPYQLAKFMLENAGFSDVEVLFLHEANKDRKHYDDPMLDELSNRLYGPRDYAVVGYKR